ncbi:MAG: hypothetical protein R2815_05295 [Flavobacteriales bacterium]|nr:hypothetical protein [Flavobacteriales bacterium]
MKTTIATLGLLLFTTLGTQAQETMSSPPPAKADMSKHECIMAGADTWTSLGLSAEQVAKVKDIQATCKKEAEAMKADATRMEGKSMDHASKHEAELKAVLTPEQYTKWTKWCEEKHGSKMKSDSSK